MEITNYRKNTKPNSILKSSFSVSLTWEDLKRLNTPIILDCTYFEKDNREFWINPCGKEYTNKEGKKKNWNMARLPNANMQEVYSEWKRLLLMTDPDASADLPF
jgi:hypothetical protein